nr:integrase, catalytic region, zinc finger, CCHC-type, peptidase aspartic, catalytic [Tanacetum cinerariifolium]
MELYSQGLSPDVYALVNHHKVAKDICDRVKLLMQGISLSKQDRECKMYGKFDKFSDVKGEILHQCYLRFAQLFNDMNIIQMTMQLVQVNTKFLNSLPLEWGKFVTDVKLARNLHTSNYDQLYAYLEQHEMVESPFSKFKEDKVRMLSVQVYKEMLQCTQPKKRRDASWFKEKVLLVQAHAEGKELDEEQLAFLIDLGVVDGQVAQRITHYAAFQTDDLDAYDFDCDDISSAKVIFMANLSSCDSDVLSERIKPILYDGNVLSKTHDVLSVVDDEETLILAEESRLKMVEKQNDPIMNKEKINITLINYTELNKLAEGFGKHFIPQQELSVEQKFWLQSFDKNFEEPSTSNTPVKIEVPRELPKNHPEVQEYFEQNDLKAQLRAKDTVINKLKETIHSLRANVNPAKVKKDIDEIETINIELEHSVAKLLSENEKLHKEKWHLKKTQKELYDSIKPSRVHAKEQCCPNCLVVFGLRMLQAYDQKPLQLTNFVNKFLCIVKFGNDQIAKIMGYGDYQIRNVTNSRVYYVEGLGHKLLSVGQFCDSDLEVAFRKHTCFVCNLEDVDLLMKSQGTNLYKLSIAKADVGIFIRYAPAKKAYLIYNRRTRRNMETIHVDFDELIAMASEQSSSGPALHEMTLGTLSSRLVPQPPSSTPFVSPTRDDWDTLLQPLFDEHFRPPPCVDHPVLEIVSLVSAVSTGSPYSTSVHQDTPSPSTSQTSQASPSYVVTPSAEEADHDIEVSHMDNNP